jgi:hypothetical protein
MKKFKSVRNGQIAELVSENEQQVTIRLEESREERNISHATLKRWWKPMKDEEVQGQPQEEPKQEETKSEKKTKTEKASKQKRETISGDHPLKVFIEQLSEERQTEVFVATVPGFRSLKVDGRMYMAFTFNKKGVTLWMRSAAVKDITEFKKMNHMFDARVQFSEDNKASKDKITKLLDASLEFQKNKQAGKASK